MYLEKPLLLPVCAGIIASIVILTTGFVVFFKLYPAIANIPLTPGVIWRYVWSIGIADPSNICQLSIKCRLSNFKEIIQFDPFRHRVILLMFATFVSGIVAFAAAVSRSALRENAQTIHGNKILYDLDARQSLRTKLKCTGQSSKDSLWLMPHVQLTDEAEAFNIGVLGDHGSGKSGVLRGWAEQIIQRNLRAIIHDAKGDITSSLPVDRCLLVAARDERASTWAIGEDIVNAQDAAEVAVKFIPTSSTGESIWTDSARTILTALIETLQKNKGSTWGWEDLYDVVFQSPLKIRAALEKISAPATLIIDFDNSGALSRTSQSILLTLWITALTTIKPLVDLAKAIPKERRFSIKAWLSTESKLPKTIILQHAADYPMLSSAISGLLVEIVASKILALGMQIRSEPWLYLILDELPVLKRLEKLPTLLNVGREKGVRCIGATQDWEQIIKLYGPEDAATLEARFKIKVVCALGISETRDRVVQRFGGIRTILEWDYAGEGKPKVRRESQIPVIQPNQLSDDLGVHRKGKSLVVRVAIFGLGAVAVVNIPFTAWPRIRRAHVPIKDRT